MVSNTSLDTWWILGKNLIDLKSNFFKPSKFNAYYIIKGKDSSINNHIILQFSSVQSLRRVRLFGTPWTAAHQASLSIINSKFTQTHVHWVGDAIQSSHSLSSPSPPASNPSQHQGIFQWVNSLHEVAKVLKKKNKNMNFTLREPEVRSSPEL